MLEEEVPVPVRERQSNVNACKLQATEVFYPHPYLIYYTPDTQSQIYNCYAVLTSSVKFLQLLSSRMDCTLEGTDVCPMDVLTKCTACT